MRLVFLALLFTISATAQKYQIEATGQLGMAQFRMTKVGGTIEITDDLVIFEIETMGQVFKGDYDITNKRNGAIYCTDGTKDFEVLVSPQVQELKLQDIIDGKIVKIKGKVKTTHVLVLKDLASAFEMTPAYYVNVIE